MNRPLLTAFSTCLLLVLASCGRDDDAFDATGNFEAGEIIVAAESNGKIMRFDLEEGNVLKANAVVGYIDTTQLHLRKQQLEYSIRSVLARQPNALVQLATIEEQIATAKFEKSRVEKLLAQDAATQKQLDDLNAQLKLLERQFQATKSSLSVTTQSLYSETLPLRAQVEQVKDQIRRSVIVNPIDGTVLTKYAEENEMTSAGKALYKIADLTTLRLRAYISSDQLSSVKIGQTVKVRVDDRENEYRSYDGTVTWISDEAEFTPKTIQTQDERANLVYAIRIDVKNDGLLKTGMYGEVDFESPED